MKKSVLLFVTAFISVPVIVFVFLTCMFLSSHIYEQKAKTLQVEVNNLADYIESTFTTQYNRVASHAQEPEFLAYLQDQSNQEKLQNAQTVLLHTYSTADNASEVSLISSDGSILLSSNLTPPESIADSTLYKEISKTQLPYIYTNFEKNLPLITIGFPIVSDGQLMGIYTRTTALRYVPIFCENLNLDDENIYILTNQNQVMIYRPNNEYSILPINELSENGISDNIGNLISMLENTSSTKGVLEFINGTSENVGGYRIIRTLNWICLVSQSRASILYNINMFQLFTFIFAILYILAVIYAINKYFGTRITKITEYSTLIKEFLDGNNDIECDTSDKVRPIYDLSTGINNLFNKIRADNRDIIKLNNEVTNLRLVDPITGLNNIKAIHNLILDKFEKYDNQALVMFNTGIFDDINHTFGEDISNRLLEIVTHLLQELNLDHAHFARLSKDKFVIFFEEFEDVVEINEVLEELRVRLKSMPRIDDLQVSLSPNIVAVFRNDKMGSTDEWIDMVKTTFRNSKTPEGSFVIYDFNATDEILDNVIETFDNILETNEEGIEGFSPSKKNKN